MNLIEKVRIAPKTELHCHLDGSVRPETLFELIMKDKEEFKKMNYQDFVSMVTIDENCSSLVDYLERFKIPNEVMQTKENLKRITLELIEDVSKDGVRYIEIRFAPKLHVKKGLTEEEVIESVLEGIKEGEKKYNVISRIILCCMRHDDILESQKTINLASKYKDLGVIAVDLAGNEHDFPPEIHKQAFDLADKKNLNITIHAGETGIENNIVKSVNLLHAKRIGHGIYAYKNKDIVQFLKEKQIPLEVCVTSNIDTKAVKSFKDHPVKEYLDEGLMVTINTDNRTVSNITLMDEYKGLIENHELTSEEVYKLILNGIESIFENDKIKNQLKNELKTNWNK